MYTTVSNANIYIKLLNIKKEKNYETLHYPHQQEQQSYCQLQN